MHCGRCLLLSLAGVVHEAGAFAVPHPRNIRRVLFQRNASSKPTASSKNSERLSTNEERDLGIQKPKRPLNGQRNTLGHDSRGPGEGVALKHSKAGTRQMPPQDGDESRNWGPTRGPWYTDDWPRSRSSGRVSTAWVTVVTTKPTTITTTVTTGAATSSAPTSMARSSSTGSATNSGTKTGAGVSSAPVQSMAGSPSQLQSSHNSSNTAAIAAGVTVPVVVLIAIIGILLFLWRRRNWPFRRKSEGSGRPGIKSVSSGGTLQYYADAEGRPRFFQSGDTGTSRQLPVDLSPPGPEPIPDPAAAAAAKMREAEKRWGSNEGEKQRGSSRRGGRWGTRSNASDGRRNGSGNGNGKARSIRSFRSQLLDGLGSFVSTPLKQPAVYPEVAYLYDPPLASRTKSAPTRVPEHFVTSPTPPPPMVRERIARQPELSTVEVSPGILTSTSAPEAGPSGTSRQENKGPKVSEREHPAYKNQGNRPFLDRNASSMSTMPGTNCEPRERVPIVLDEQSVSTPTQSPEFTRNAAFQPQPTIAHSPVTPSIGSPYESPTAELEASAPFPSPSPMSPTHEVTAASFPSPPSMQQQARGPRLITSFDDPYKDKKESIVSPASPLLPTAVSENVREATTAVFTSARRSNRRSIPVSAMMSPPPPEGRSVSIVRSTRRSTPSPTTTPIAASMSRRTSRKSRTASLDKPLPALPMLMTVPGGMATQIEEEPSAEPAWENWRAEVEREVTQVLGI